LSSLHMPYAKCLHQSCKRDELVVAVVKYQESLRLHTKSQ
jgi:hypothetical protein